MGDRPTSRGAGAGYTTGASRGAPGCGGHWWGRRRRRPTGAKDLDKAFRLAIGAGRVGPGAHVLQPAGRAVAAPRVRGIGRRVIRHHRPHGDPLGAEPGQRPLEEGEGGAAPVRGPHLGVGQPGVIVDGDMDMLPARAGTAPDAVLPNALADVPEAGQLLGVEVEQLPGWARS